MNIDILPNVYEPEEDSYLLANLLRQETIQNLKLCDMGCGSGVLSLYAAQFGAIVTAVDKNPQAIMLTKNNAKKNGLHIEVIQSNFFEKITKKFDIIISNPPYLPANKSEPDDEITQSIVGGKHGYEWTIEFLHQAKEHLEPSGILLFIVSSLSKPQKVEECMQNCGFTYQKIKSKSTGGFETLHVYQASFIEEIKELRKQKYYDIKVHAKGKRGIVFKAIKNNKTFAVKIAKTTDRKIIDHEVHMLKKVNSFGIGPKLEFFDEKMIGMEFIEGTSLDKIWETIGKKQKIEYVEKILKQLIILDERGINKKELTRPYKNVLVTPQKNIVLLDFERAQVSEKAKNLTQISQFISRYLTSSKKNELQNKAKEYRQNQIASERFAKIILDTFKNSEYP